MCKISVLCHAQIRGNKKCEISIIFGVKDFVEKLLKTKYLRFTAKAFLLIRIFELDPESA